MVSPAGTADALGSSQVSRSSETLRGYKLAIVALKAKSNWLADTKPLMPKVLEMLTTAKPGTLTVISYGW